MNIGLEKGLGIKCRKPCGLDMKDINEVQKYRDGAGGQRQETGSKNNKDKIKKRVQNSGPRNIKDAANILGIPQKEYTPSVQEAFSSIFHDLPRFRKIFMHFQNLLGCRFPGIITVFIDFLRFS